MLTLIYLFLKLPEALTEVLCTKNYKTHLDAHTLHYTFGQYKNGS